MKYKTNGYKVVHLRVFDFSLDVDLALPYVEMIKTNYHCDNTSKNVP